MTVIAMPRLSDSMEEGTILSWLKASGDTVERGEELVEIETDKATATYESPVTGTLSTLASEGSTLAIGEPIASVATETEPPASDDVAPPAAAPASSSPIVPVPPAGASLSRVSSGGASTNGLGGSGATVRATPLARRVAAEQGIEIQTVPGTGPRGRITRADVATVASALSSPAPASASTAPPAASDAKGVVTTITPTRTQLVIARRMTETKATVPDFQVQAEARMDEVLALRERLKAIADRAPSVNDFIVKAAALALREFPLANGSYQDGVFHAHSRVNVGVAVATDGALVVPTVTDADTRSLGSIAGEVRRLAQAVRDGTIAPSELGGATFTVSNLGMYGITSVTSVLNAPQAAILGVGAAREVLAREDGEIVDRRLMTMTLTCDHRIVYGAEAAQLLSRIRDLLEQPLLLAL
jgi:pyruvate dehydrogenase E2 component (dihydrolipoamide acetyltransferase)